MKIKIPVEVDGEYWVYTVETGDSWWGLAKEFLGDGNKMHKLAKYNGTTIAKTLHPNDSLKIPYNEDKIDGTTPAAEIEHTVKIGESWWSIAKKFMGNGNKMYELAKYNGKTVKYVLHPGSTVMIPD
jgi:nucleoid-associated protein YgaU